MSAPVTEAHRAHRALVESIRRCLIMSGTHCYSDEAAAQLLADSEARAVEAERDRNRELFVRINRENGQLRAALCAVKLECLTAKDGRAALGHIVRICIDAGIKEESK